MRNGIKGTRKAVMMQMYVEQSEQLDELVAYYEANREAHEPKTSRTNVVEVLIQAEYQRTRLYEKANS